jgi:hypothetical protein
MNRVVLACGFAVVSLSMWMGCSSSDSSTSTPGAGGSAGKAGAAGTAGTAGASGAGDSGVAGSTGDAAQDHAAEACVDPTEPVSTVCNVVKQDCACGRCVIWMPDSTTTEIESACAPVRGNAALGEACTREADVVGDDTCAAGFFCSGIGKPKDATAERLCRKYCTAASDCGQGEWCISAEPVKSGFGPFGFCVTRCDPFAPACATGSGCSLGYVDMDGFHDLVCYAQKGTKKLGEACESADECEPNAVCVGATGASQCVAFCDDNHPCGDAGACTPIDTSSVSACIP